MPDRSDLWLDLNYKVIQWPSTSHTDKQIKYPWISTKKAFRDLKRFIEIEEKKSKKL